MQINHYNVFPIRTGSAAVEPAQQLTLHEAARLWWLPKTFNATVSVDCPYVPSPGTPVVFDFSGANALVRTPPLGVPADETGLCFPGLDLGAASYGTGARFTGSVALYSGTSCVLELTLFAPHTAPLFPGVWTDGTSWQVRAAITGALQIGGVQALIHKDDDNPAGTIGTDFENFEPAVTYMPEAGVLAPYTRPPGATYLWVPTHDALAWTLSITAVEATWFEHGGLWLPAAGTARQRAP